MRSLIKTVAQVETAMEIVVSTQGPPCLAMDVSREWAPIIVLPRHHALVSIACGMLYLSPGRELARKVLVVERRVAEGEHEVTEQEGSRMTHSHR